MSLPIYQMVISPDPESELQVDYVALVDKPAIEKNFLAFNDKRLQFTTDTVRRIISGPAMLADTPIYRRDAENGEYLVQFDAATIEQIAQKFFQKGFNQNFNLMHDPSLKLEGVTVFESFIVDPSRGIQPMAGFEDAPVGSWFMSAKVNNDEAWALIESGKVKGFSVEGVFQYKKQKLSKAEIWAQIESLMLSLAD
jgi:hypothetical protein